MKISQGASQKNYDVKRNFHVTTYVCVQTNRYSYCVLYTVL